ncbi:hypothetical protein [Streptomyces mirabilis]|uniref:hypothetical protein n=1 Tax=Streptomyces mirabilis TaxID=68239 RepID=UPI003654E2B6
MGTQDPAGSQLAEVWQTDAGQFVEKVGLRSADALERSLRAGAKGAAFVEYR